MGTNALGYIEINTIQKSEEDIWFELIRIDVLAERNYEIFGSLFGVRNTKGTQPLASSRGIPDKTSNKSVFINSDSIVNHSWVAWSELTGYLSINSLNFKQHFGWSFIFSNMENLSNHYGKSNVRLVIAFDNYG